MIRAASLANAITIMMSVIYVVCATLSVTVPNLLLSLSQSWIHALNLKAIEADVALTLTTFAFGLVSAIVLTWVVTYVTANIYNYFAHREQAAERHHKGYAVA